MKERIITAAIAIPLLLLLLLVAPSIVTAVIFSLLLGIGAYELMYSTGLVRHGRLVLYSVVMAVAVGMWSYFGAQRSWAMLGILVFAVFLFSELMMNHIKVRFEMLAISFFAGVIMPYLLSALIRIFVMIIGREVILLPFIITFLSDGGAYFVGIKFGKHKLAPVVSPNKTVEGMLGGIAAATIGVMLYALLMRFAMDFRVNFAMAFIYGLAGSVAGVFGDLCFSAIKRQTGIKDYGHLLPGHGGVLDRFDSMMMVAPLMEALLLLAPVVI